MTRTNDGMTAGMCAKMRGSEDVARVLIAAVADVNIRDSKMIAIPGGTFIMGRDPGIDQFGEDISIQETPAFPVSIEPFFIGRYEVTNHEYREFVRETGYQPPSD